MTALPAFGHGGIAEVETGSLSELHLGDAEAPSLHRKLDGRILRFPDYRAPGSLPTESIRGRRNCAKTTRQVTGCSIVAPGDADEAMRSVGAGVRSASDWRATPTTGGTAWPFRSDASETRGSRRSTWPSTMPFAVLRQRSAPPARRDGVDCLVKWHPLHHRLASDLADHQAP